MRGRSLLPLLVALAACDAGSNGTAVRAQAPLVEVASAAPAAPANAVRASGLLGFRREPPLAFASPGVIGEILVDEGDVVRRGQRLATLRRVSVGSNVNEAALAQANAEHDLARAERLFAEGFISQARLDDARLAVERSRGAAVLTSPADGVILRRSAEPAQMVAAGAPIFVLGETASHMVVRATIAGADTARVRVGDSAVVRPAGNAGDERQGQVTRVAAKGDDGTGAFEVEVEIGSPDNLRSGMVAEVEITSTIPAPDAVALVIPTLALLDARADQGVVFVIDAQDVARRRAVRTSGVTQAGVLVVEGLAPGERVAAAGAAYARDGEPVRVADN